MDVFCGLSSDLVVFGGLIETVYHTSHVWLGQRLSRGVSCIPSVVPTFVYLHKRTRSCVYRTNGAPSAMCSPKYRPQLSALKCCSCCIYRKEVQRAACLSLIALEVLTQTATRGRKNVSCAVHTLPRRPGCLPSGNLSKFFADTLDALFLICGMNLQWSSVSYAVTIARVMSFFL